MEIQHNVPLKDYTTLKTGGSARLFCVVRAREELLEAIAYSRKENIPFYILGGGSNVLVSQNGFDGLIIKIATQGISFVDMDAEMVRMSVEAGVLWDECVETSILRGLYGLENLSLIPGSVGAAPIQNIGAYGVEVGNVIESVEVFNLKTNTFEIIPKDACQFEYRSSIFKKREGKEYIVITVHFLLSKKGTLKTEYKDVEEYYKENPQELTLSSLRSAIIAIRTRKLPNLKIVGTAGSFFLNPIVPREIITDLAKHFPAIPIYDIQKPNYVKTSAAFLIDKVAGMKGVRKGDVGTYENQALVLVNHSNATGEDILAFAKNIQKEVLEKTGIPLELEVQTLGF